MCMLRGVWCVWCEVCYTRLMMHTRVLKLATLVLTRSPASIKRYIKDGVATDKLALGAVQAKNASMVFDRKLKPMTRSNASPTTPCNSSEIVVRTEYGQVMCVVRL